MKDECERSNYEKDRIAHAKRIMKPFFLRRLKSDVSISWPKFVIWWLEFWYWRRLNSLVSSFSWVLNLHPTFSVIVEEKPLLSFLCKHILFCIMQVLTDLPAKIASIERVPMSTRQVGLRLKCRRKTLKKRCFNYSSFFPQAELYFQLVADYKDRAAKVKTTKDVES